jgi:hypothetical protein
VSTIGVVVFASHFKQKVGLVEHVVQLVAVQELPTQAVPFEVAPYPHPGLEEVIQ